MSECAHARYNAGCTLSSSAFGESLEREFPETRLGECDPLHSCRELSILVCDTRRQPGETRDPLTRAHGPLKKRDLNEARHKCRGYTRGSKARRMFPSTFSLSPSLGFSQRECTAGIMDLSAEEASFIVEHYFHSSLIKIIDVFPVRNKRLLIFF